MTEPTTTEIAFHDVTHLQAAAYDTKGAPLVLRIVTSFGKAEIILYLDEQVGLIYIAILSSLQGPLK
jgi:hypothetical protein